MKADGLTEILQTVADKNKVNVSTTREVVDFTMKMVRECIEMPSMPAVLLRGLGRFHVTKKRINTCLRNLDLAKQKPDDIEQKKEQYKKILNRLENEKVRSRKPNV